MQYSNEHFMVYLLFLTNAEKERANVVSRCFIKTNGLDLKTEQFVLAMQLIKDYYNTSKNKKKATTVLSKFAVGLTRIVAIDKNYFVGLILAIVNRKIRVRDLKYLTDNDDHYYDYDNLDENSKYPKRPKYPKCGYQQMAQLLIKIWEQYEFDVTKLNYDSSVMNLLSKNINARLGLSVKSAIKN